VAETVLVWSTSKDCGPARISRAVTSLKTGCAEGSTQTIRSCYVQQQMARLYFALNTSHITRLMSQLGQGSAFKTAHHVRDIV